MQAVLGCFRWLARFMARYSPNHLWLQKTWQQKITMRKIKTKDVSSYLVTSFCTGCFSWGDLPGLSLMIPPTTCSGEKRRKRQLAIPTSAIESERVGRKGGWGRKGRKEKTAALLLHSIQLKCVHVLCIESTPNACVRAAENLSKGFKRRLRKALLPYLILFEFVSI